MGALIGLVRFPGRRVVQALVYTGMGFPPVVVGLMVYLLLSRSGILGPMNWAWVPELFTVPAMILAQVIIAMPLIVGYTMAAVAEVDPTCALQVRSLGAPASRSPGPSCARRASCQLSPLVGGWEASSRSSPL